MIKKEDFYMIKQMHQQGIFNVDIAHKIGCSERTVRRCLALPAPPSGRPKKAIESKLDPFKAFIDKELADEVWNSAVIFDQIKEQGYTGGRTLVRNYIQPKRPLRASKKTVRYETKPGIQLQHDWGELFTEVAGQQVKVNISVNTLGYSRRFHVWAAPSQDAHHTYEGLIKAFEYFGGTTNEVLVDNQKAAVISHTYQGEVVFNPGFLELSVHYGFKAKACRPRRARTKGKTERMVGYVKHHFFQRYRSFESWTHLNQLLENWLRNVADQRHLRKFNATPKERFEHENLQSLPERRFDTSYSEVRQVSWDSFIEVRGNRYSVPSHYCGLLVKIKISLDQDLKIFNTNDELLAQYHLCAKTDGWQTTSSHHKELWQDVMRRPLTEYEELANES